MASKLLEDHHGAVGAWAKRCYFAGRAAMGAMLRPFDLGPTQWYILHRLIHDGPVKQRDLGGLLQIERATLTVIVAALVRKGWVEQVPDDADLRRKWLHVTPEGRALWNRLPDLAAVINAEAFDGINDTDMEAAVRVLRTATERLDAFLDKEQRA